MEQGKKDSLKVQALTQRIATLVAQYEDQLADLRAEASILVESLNTQVESLNTQVKDWEFRFNDLQLELERAYNDGVVSEEADTDSPDA